MMRCTARLGDADLARDLAHALLGLRAMHTSTCAWLLKIVHWGRRRGARRLAGSGYSMGRMIPGIHTTVFTGIIIRVLYFLYQVACNEE